MFYSARVIRHLMLDNCFSVVYQFILTTMYNILVDYLFQSGNHLSTFDSLCDDFSLI